MSEKPDWLSLSETPGNTCPHMQTSNHDCIFRYSGGPSVCNMLASEKFGDKAGEHRRCGARFYRMCELHDLMPELWSDQVCCNEWRQMMLQCAEDSGFMAGGVDIRIYPNDGKDVWRNYYRTRFQFCPFCGKAK